MKDLYKKDLENLLTDELSHYLSVSKLLKYKNDFSEDEVELIKYEAGKYLANSNHQLYEPDLFVLLENCGSLPNFSIKDYVIVDTHAVKQLLQISNISKNFEKIASDVFNSFNFTSGMYFVQHHLYKIRIAYEECFKILFEYFPEYLEEKDETHILNDHSKNQIYFALNFLHSNYDVKSILLCCLFEKFKRINFENGKEYNNETTCEYFSKDPYNADQHPLCLNPEFYSKEELFKINQMLHQKKLTLKVKDKGIAHQNIDATDTEKSHLL